MELEGGYRPSHIKEADFAARREAHPDWSAMGNVLWDLLPDAHVDTFIGGGIGVGRVSVNALDAPLFATDDTRTSFAWQGIAGLTWPIGEAHQPRPGDLSLHFDVPSISMSSGEVRPAT